MSVFDGISDFLEQRIYVDIDSYFHENPALVDSNESNSRCFTLASDILYPYKFVEYLKNCLKKSLSCNIISTEKKGSEITIVFSDLGLVYEKYATLKSKKMGQDYITRIFQDCRVKLLVKDECMFLDLEYKSHQVFKDTIQIVLNTYLEYV